jgi:hypothetical protein
MSPEMPNMETKVDSKYDEINISKKKDIFSISFSLDVKKLNATVM